MAPRLVAERHAFGARGALLVEQARTLAPDSFDPRSRVGRSLSRMLQSPLGVSASFVAPAVGSVEPIDLPFRFGDRSLGSRAELLCLGLLPLEGGQLAGNTREERVDCEGALVNPSCARRELVHGLEQARQLGIAFVECDRGVEELTSVRTRHTPIIPPDASPGASFRPIRTQR